MDCTLCSISSFLFGCVKSLIVAALENPLLLLLLCFLFAWVVLTHVHTAHLICSEADTSSSSRSVAHCESIPNCACDSAELLAAACAAEKPVKFDYGIENGPHTWRVSQDNQSPINIIDSAIVKLPIRELLTWNHIEDMPDSMMIHNTGNTVVLRACYSGNMPTVSGADLFACYTFVELCFRWSMWDSEGSEHAINYHKYPLELQAMFRTGPSTAPCTSSYDILMVSYLFEISSENPYLNGICQNLHRVRNAGQRTEISPFPLSYLCFPFRTGFYSYGGSLTEPPCYEGAEWFIYPETIAIGRSQLKEFRTLLGSDKLHIVRNSRPLQNLTDTRIVNLNEYKVFESLGMDSSEETLETNAEEENLADMGGGGEATTCCASEV